MTALRNIISVAHYERIMLTRTTRFRFLGFVGIAIPMFFGVVLAIAETFGEITESASVFGLSAFVPFYFYTYAQTVLTAFVAGNFRAADDHAEVGEVIAVRPMSTAQIVLGKYLGVLQALAGLGALVALLTMAIQAAKLSIIDAPFILTPYFYYFFLMLLPALIFMSALTFSLGAIFRNRTVVALVSVAYVLAVLFYLGFQYDGLFDFGAFFAPLFYSDMLGVGDIGRLLQIRVMYLALSFALLGLAVASYPRLPNPGWGGKIGHAMALFGLVGTFGAYSVITRGDAAMVDERARLLATQIMHADIPVPTVRHYDLDLALMNQDAPLTAKVGLRLANENNVALERLIFTLNPGLELGAVHDASGEALPFEVEGSVIRVELPLPLQPGREIDVSMAYAGDIDRNGFDLMRGAARRAKWDGPIHKGDLTAWIEDGSAFLPPRSRWYPVPGVDYGHEGTRPVSFSTARIAIDVPAGLTAITQGEPVAPAAAAVPVANAPGTTGDRSGDRSRQVWEVTRPVPILSLNVDTYDVVEAEIAGTLVSLYVAPIHMPQLEFFEDALDEVESFVEQLLRTMESETGLPYPYPRLSIVEIPFLVQWYYEGWEESGGLTQPGILMIEEDALIERLTRVRVSFDRAMNSEHGRGQNPARLKRDQLASAVFTAFLSSDRGRNNSSGLFRSPLVQLWSFNRDFVGTNAPLMSRGMPVYMQEDVTASMRSLMFERHGNTGRSRGTGGGGARVQERGGDDSGSISRDRSIGSGALVSWDEQLVAMQRDALADLDAEAKPDLYRAVLDTKALTMFRVIEAVVGSGAFVDAIGAFGSSTAYQQVSFDDFEQAVVPARTTASAAAGADDSNLERLIRDWVHGTEIPGYAITRATTLKRENDWGAVVYQVMVRIRNGEPGRGFVQVQLEGRDDAIFKNVQIEGGQEVEVSMIIGSRPARVNIEPFLAKNRRQLGVPLRVPEEVSDGVPESYVRLIIAKEAAYTEIIVDNEDEGFSMPIRRVRRYLRPGLRGDNWRVWHHNFAFGRYETNYRWRPAGDGAQPAIWATSLPHTGSYEVAYYYLPERISGRRIRYAAADNFRITVFHAGGETTLDMSGARLEPGWNTLGSFRFGAHVEARVELSDAADGRVYADAIRWRYVDPDNPNALHYDGVAPWESASREYPGGR